VANETGSYSETLIDTNTGRHVSPRDVVVQALEPMHTIQVYKGLLEIKDTPRRRVLR